MLVKKISNYQTENCSQKTVLQAQQRIQKFVQSYCRNILRDFFKNGKSEILFGFWAHFFANFDQKLFETVVETAFLVSSGSFGGQFVLKSYKLCWNPEWQTSIKQSLRTQRKISFS